ncbi:hypothetical protein EMIT0194MI4_30490 [Pseudomonas sp. IT-194MI4]
MLGSLQALVGAHDAHIVPHESPQFVPVVRDDHVFVGVGDLAGIPDGQGGRNRHLWQLLKNVRRRRTGINETFQQRVAGHAVGAMQAGEAGFTNRIQARHVGAAPLIDHHAAAGVVRRRHHRNRLFGDVDREFQAAFIDRREVRLDEVFRLVADVQVNAVDTQALHLMVDGAGDDVPWCQLGPWIEALHEAFAVRQLQVSAFAAQGFGDQETLGLRVIKAGRVELVELQVRHPAARTPGHGDAITAGAIRVAGIEVDLRRAARRKDHEARTVSVDFTRAAVEDVGTEAAVAFKAQALFGDQIDCDPLFQQLDVGPLYGLVEQGSEDRRTCRIGGVDDASMAVTAFAGQVKLETAVFGAGLFVTGKGYALVDQPLNRFSAVLDGKAHGVFMAQATPGVEGIVDVGLDSIGVIQDGGDTALGPEGRAIGEVAFAQYGDAQMTGQGQRKTQAGSTAANYQNIVLKLLAHFRIPLKATRVGGGARQLDRRVRTATQPTSI